MLKAADDAKTMTTLLKHKPVCQVTAEVVESAAARLSNSSKLLELLLTHDHKAPVTAAAIKAALGNRYMNDPDTAGLKLLLEHGREVEVSNEMLEIAE